MSPSPIKEIRPYPFMDDSIALLNKVFLHDLPGPEPFQNSLIRTELLPHQNRLLNAMQKHKRVMLYGYDHQQQFIHGKLGIIADPPGSGKTLTVLAFLAAEQQQPSPSAFLAQQQPSPSSFGELSPHSNRFFSSFYRPLRTDSSSVNVIVVPSTLLHQWETEIQTHTHFKPVVIQNRRPLRNRSTQNNNLFLITNRRYREVYAYCQERSIRWANLFLDDATSLYLSPNDPVPDVEFLWCITSQWHHLLFKNMHLPLVPYSSLHKDCRTWMEAHGPTVLCTTEASSFYRSIVPWTHPERHTLVLKNRDCDIPYVLINTVTMECASQYTLANLPMSIIGANYSGITHEAIPNLFSALGVRSWTVDQLKGVHGRSELIDSKLHDACCTICLENPQNTVFLPCCMNVFCGACILRQLIMHAQCPLCRSLLVLPSLLPLRFASEERAPILTKQDTCVEYILNHRTQSFLVYTIFENTYYQIQPLLAENGISCELLDLPLNRFNRSLQAFQTGSTSVLFVSNLDLIRGLNLSKADCLILFYEIPVFERRQVLLHSMVRLDQQRQKTVLQLQSQL